MHGQVETETCVVQQQDATRPATQVCPPYVHGCVDRDMLTSSKKQTSAVDIGPNTVTHVEVPRSLENDQTDPHVESGDRSRPTTHHDARLLNHIGEPAGTAAVAKMDTSQQTPTQVNEDRDYNAVCDSLPSSSAHGDSKQMQDGNYERTLQDDDTGAVNFGNLGEFGRPSSQVSEDGGFENTRGDWRQPDQTSQQLSSHAYTPFKSYGAAPETPALPKNPFGTKPSIAAPFAGSQLFGQTQFSSAIKPPGISPTSSRPSPNIMHNSISPNVAETSPLKDRTTVSSPTDIRTSSPHRLDEVPVDVPATVCRPKALERIEEETPSHNRSMREETIPESPTVPPPRSSGSHQPLAHYEKMKKSQERKLTGGLEYQFVGSDSDDDDTTRHLERRKRVERKKAQAAQEIEKVSFTPLPRRDSGDRPSSKRRRIASGLEGKTASNRVPRMSEPSKSSSEQPLIADSQRQEAASNQAPADESTQGTEDPAPEADAMQLDNGDGADGNVDEPQEMDDIIPATSPALSPSPDEEPDPQPQSEPDLPRLGGETLDLPQSNDPGTSSLPPTRHRSQMTYGRRTRPPRRMVVSSSASELTPKEPAISTDRPSSPVRSPASTAVAEDNRGKSGPETGAVAAVSDAKETGKTPRQEYPPKSSAPMTTRSRDKGRSPITPQASEAEEQRLATSSDLSSLSSAPSSSAMTTPLTRESPGSDRAESVDLPSPAGGRNLRKSALRTGAKQSVSPQPVVRRTRGAKERAPHCGSQSTDELHRPPSASVLNKSIVHPKASRTFRQSIVSVNRGSRLFEGMVFAISFQSTKSNTQNRAKLESKITDAGGVILSKGFEVLFETSSIMNTTTPVFDNDEPMMLRKAYEETGFTALIADGHSRTAKYMQALALGLPCLAHQWITACLGKGELVDWEPYLLCAGASAVLDYALRSRNLVPYSAADARLAEVVDQRRKLLEGQRILVAVDSRKGRSEAKRPYIFLARALGPSISRVFTTEQAREALTTQAKEGQPFDWVYVDKKTGAVESVLRAREPQGKKRKRISAAPAPVPDNVRELNDELVIQSLILGRIVEDEDINS